MTRGTTAQPPLARRRSALRALPHAAAQPPHALVPLPPGPPDVHLFLCKPPGPLAGRPAIAELHFSYVDVVGFLWHRDQVIIPAAQTRRGLIPVAIPQQPQLRLLPLLTARSS